MKFGPNLAAIAALTFGLAACEDSHDGMAANGKICASWTTPAAATPTANAVAPMPGDAASPVDTCVKHWAYSLAAAHDGADVVADAAVAACASQLSMWNQGTLQGGPEGQSISTLTGLPTNGMAEHAAFARSQALLYVVEARAGHCKPPAVVNGAPVGA